MSKNKILAQMTVATEYTGWELARYAKKIMGVSNRQLQKVSRTRGLLVNDRPAHSKKKLKTGDRVRLLLPSSEQIRIPVASHQDLIILYEDAWIIAVEKPPGLPTYSTQNKNGLANQVIGYFISHGVTLTPRPLHRLDAKSSGIVLFAKSAAIQTDLTRLWRDGLVQRVYWALCTGEINKPLELNMPLDGQKAYTKITPLKNYGHCTELRVELITGRTHQIRRHLALIGHPIVGDSLHGSDSDSRLGLHACELSFPHPRWEGKILNIQSAPPLTKFPI